MTALAHGRAQGHARPRMRAERGHSRRLGRPCGLAACPHALFIATTVASRPPICPHPRNVACDARPSSNSQPSSTTTRRQWSPSGSTSRSGPPPPPPPPDCFECHRRPARGLPRRWLVGGDAAARAPPRPHHLSSRLSALQHRAVGHPGPVAPAVDVRPRARQGNGA